MEYTKVNCYLQPDTEINREILIAELANIGFESFAETEEFIESYIPSIDYSKDKLFNLYHDDYLSFKFQFTAVIIPDENWNQIWEKNYFKPLIIADKCLIRAPFHDEVPYAEYEIIIEPCMAFGTGNHETTSLMIEEILEENLYGKTVLDMGCGTGILSILASKKGAKSITSIDIDQWAVNSTVENSIRNKINNLEVLLGGAEQIKNNQYDFIYANIHRNILLNDLPQYVQALNQGGELIMSGFYLSDLVSIETRAYELGLLFKKHSEKENWAVGVFTLK